VNHNFSSLCAAYAISGGKFCLAQPGKNFPIRQFLPSARGRAENAAVALFTLVRKIDV